MTRQILKHITIPFLILVFRDFRLFLHPRLWAEEGTIYFRDAYLFGFRTILEPELGYYSFLPKTFCWIASLFPLEVVPLIMTLLSTFVWLLPHVLISLSKNEYLLSYRNKILCSLILLITAPSDEIFLNSINLHFLTPWIIILIGLDDLGKNSKVLNICYSVIVWLLILNGPVAIFILPIYIYLILIQKKYKFLFLSISSVLIQLYFITSYNSTNSIQDRFDFSLREFNQVFYYRTLINPYLGGFENTNSFFNLLGMHNILRIQNIVIIFFLGVIAYGIKVKNKIAPPLMLGSLLVSILTYASALNPKFPGLLTGSGRYFYLPNTLLSIGLLSFILKETNLKKIQTIFFSIPVLLVVYSSGIEYFRTSPYCLDCPNWRSEIRQNFPQTKTIQIWPRGWTINLNQPPP